jgi:hypothetical protein
MTKITKPIRLSGHACEQLTFRGATEEFPFNATWNRREYATKQIRPIFVEEPDEIVVVTVYVYYF